MANQDNNKDSYSIAWEEANTEIEALHKKFRIEHTYTKKDAKEVPKAKVGNKTTRNPVVPQNPQDAFELFKEYYAMVQYHLQKPGFIQKYKIWNKASVKAEIDEIEKWITNANTLNYNDALKRTNKNSHQYEYLRLANGYYDGYTMTWEEHQTNSTAAYVYGRYFLFYAYLKDKHELYQYTSKYLPKIEITFEDLPKYVIQQGILQRFDAVAFVKTSDYDDWKSGLLEFLKTIPSQFITKSIRKGIEFAQKAYNFHLKNECKKTDHCRYNESWERRIAIAEHLLNAIIKENKESRKDFKNWLLGEPDWKEIAWQYNSNRAYQGKQDLIAVFWNSYIYYQQKLEPYFNEFNEIPKVVFSDIIFRFRQFFPLKDRVEGVSYFDDLIEQLIAKYEAKLTAVTESENDIEDMQVNSNEFTTARQVLAVHYLLDHCGVNNIDNTVKARFIQFLTGKEAGAKAIYNTTIYKKVNNILGDKKTLINDLQFVLKYFEDLGLQSIADNIKKEIAKKAK